MSEANDCSATTILVLVGNEDKVRNNESINIELYLYVYNLLITNSNSQTHRQRDNTEDE